MTLSAQQTPSPPSRNVLDDVTLIALQNNIAFRCGYLSLRIEDAFREWIRDDGFTAFMEWLKARETDE